MLRAYGRVAALTVAVHLFDRGVSPVWKRLTVFARLRFGRLVDHQIGNSFGSGIGIGAVLPRRDHQHRARAKRLPMSILSDFRDLLTGVAHIIGRAIWNQVPRVYYRTLERSGGLNRRAKGGWRDRSVVYGPVCEAPEVHLPTLVDNALDRREPARGDIYVL